jgi:hypothetical protein
LAKIGNRSHCCVRAIKTLFPLFLFNNHAFNLRFIGDANGLNLCNKFLPKADLVQIIVAFKEGLVELGKMRLVLGVMLTRCLEDCMDHIVAVLVANYLLENGEVL